MTSNRIDTAPNYLNTSSGIINRTVQDYMNLFRNRKKEIEKDTEKNANQTFNRCRMLYEHSKFLKVKQEELIKQNEIEKSKDEIAECTFAPKLNKKINP